MSEQEYEKAVERLLDEKEDGQPWQAVYRGDGVWLVQDGDGVIVAKCYGAGAAQHIVRCANAYEQEKEQRHDA